jgi:ubiquinone/menaquinone biosynthesis C-methylase UbiE
MKARRVAALGIAAVAGAAIVGAHRWREAPANVRRYSMPNAATYELATRLVFGRRYHEIARAIAAEAPDGGTVVDLGCGPGAVLVRVAALAPSLDLTGVDIDADMIERARHRAERRFAGTARRGPRFVVADASALPFPAESVDLVVSSYAVHHLPDRHAARSEIMRVLKPGGRALIWDIVSPHGEPEGTHGPTSPSATHAVPVQGEPAPEPHAMSALAVIRMWFRFGRIPAERYELRKPLL